ncbi:FHA domain-containing protein [Corallococcus sp. AB011P]|uniref:FHA domain-containing protein n=1 Tax=unclassified Corallococcus TaxID=2685029 RepID=UPI000EA0FF5D|nr:MULTISPECIES: FHA domain-containing protein [unclassified Corallococcus]RKG54200.1 FHA domain-containing protein [Corallococcus sp. AB011P]RKH82500.1 FHA domain-containing protein [Corallococcus sp. AB045]
MGLLLQLEDGRRFTLGTRCLLGRHPACDVHIPDGRVSGEHASLHWAGAHWELRDLGSRNGTFVEGRRLASGERVELGQGQDFLLGKSGIGFRLLDASPPAARARHLATGLVRVATGALLVLPDDDEPQASLFPLDGGQWVLELGEERRRLKDQERVWLSGSEWVVELPLAATETLEEADAPTLAEVRLRIGVSRDEEHVEVAVHLREGVRMLPPRSSQYLLATLARLRLAEHALAPSEQGWVDRERLCRMLATDTNKLNVDIHRVRKQFGALGIQDAAGVVERRPGTGQVRLGMNSVEVFTL